MAGFYYYEPIKYETFKEYRPIPNIRTLVCFCDEKFAENLEYLPS
jgi:hypothetical protein